MQRCRGGTRGDGHGRGVRAVRCRAPPRRGSCLSSCDGSVPRGYGSGTSVPAPVPEAVWGTRRPSMVHIVWWSGWSPGRKEGYSRRGPGTAFPPRLSATCVRIVIGMTRHRDAARLTWQFCGFAVHGSHVAGVRPREGDDGPLRRRAGARRGRLPSGAGGGRAEQAVAGAGGGRTAGGCAVPPDRPVKTPRNLEICRVRRGGAIVSHVARQTGRVREPGHAPLAQLAEQLTLNQRVRGSSP